MTELKQNLIAFSIVPIISIVVGFLIILGSVFVKTADANPDQFENDAIQNATTTLTHLTPGTATTTHEYDTQQSRVYPAESAAYLFQMSGTSTSAIANLEFQYSDDGSDWYRDSYTVSSTTDIVNGNVYQSRTIQFASTTPGSTAEEAGDNDRLVRIYNVPTPTRYVRAVVTAASSTEAGLPDAWTSNGVGNFGFWGEFIGRRELR